VTFGPIKLPDGRLANFVNFDRASARGLELTGAARPHLRLRIAASYTFLRSRLERAFAGSDKEVGLPLLRRPRHSGSLEAGWAASRYSLPLDMSFVGKRRDIDPVSFSRFDSAGMFARVENLLNQDYAEVLGFPAYKLDFSAGLRVRLGEVSEEHRSPLRQAPWPRG